MATESCPFSYNQSGVLTLNQKCLQCKLRFLTDNYYFHFVYIVILMMLLYYKGYKYAIIFTILTICVIFYAFMCSTSVSLSIRSVESYIIVSIILYFVYFILSNVYMLTI